MEYGAIDLHKKESQIRMVTECGEVVDRRIATTRERFTSLFWGRPPMRILLEASTESEWVAQHLETLGHEVIVADPALSSCSRIRRCAAKKAELLSAESSRGESECRRLRNDVPLAPASAHHRAIVRGRERMAARPKVIADRTEHRTEPRRVR